METIEMTIRETMVAVISYLCELAKSKGYPRRIIIAGSVAEKLDLPVGAVVQALGLAEEDAYVKIHARFPAITPEREAYEDVQFTLTPRACDEYERKVLGAAYGVPITIIVQYGQQALVQIGQTNVATQEVAVTVDMVQVTAALDGLWAAAEEPELLSHQDALELRTAIDELRGELSKAKPAHEKVTRALHVLGTIASIHTALAPHYSQIAQLLGSLHR